MIHYLASRGTADTVLPDVGVGGGVSHVWHTRGRRLRYETFPLAKQL